MKPIEFRAVVCAAALVWGIALAAPLAAQTLSTGSKSTLTGSTTCRGTVFSPHQCEVRSFDTTNDLAFQENGFAQPAVAKDLISGFASIHQEEFANDGFYGNGASWIGANIGSADSWVKFDLGRTVAIDSITFGRDRIFDFVRNQFDDRDPGQFTIEVGLSDEPLMHMAPV